MADETLLNNTGVVDRNELLCFLLNMAQAKEDQSAEPLGFLWPCRWLVLEQVIWLLIFCPLHERASSQLPRDVMGIKLIADWPKLLILGILSSLSRKVCWYVGLGFQPISKLRASQEI